MTPPMVVRLRLYIAGTAPFSLKAVANLDALCRSHLQGRHHIEVIDVLQAPERALSDGVYMTPMLVKLGAEPTCRIVGTLSDAAVVLDALGVGSVPT